MADRDEDALRDSVSEPIAGRRQFVRSIAFAGMVPFTAALSGSGRSEVQQTPSGGADTAQSLGNGLRARDAFLSDYRLPVDRGDDTPAFRRAFDQSSNSRTSPPRRQGWGLDVINLSRGTYSLQSPLRWGASQLGFGIIGRATYATTITAQLQSGAALPFRTYVGVRLQDFHLLNLAPTPGESVAIDLDGTGGGGELSLKRLTIEGFGTAIRNNGEGARPGNGDKTLVEQVLFATRVGYDNTRNNQAVGWTFLNCASGCADATFRLGGAGEVAIINHIGDIYGSLIKLPEGSGNGGSGNWLGGRVTVMSSKLEYHGNGDRLLLDARESLLNGDGGGSGADIVFRDVSIASGTAPPDPARHVIMAVGNARAGSDAIRFRQDGGWIEGIVRLGSAQPGAVNRRWSFHNAVRAPHPDTVQLLGEGNHYLMEWRANENVPVDQYRGGQAFTGAIDAQKAFLWRHIGRALINTGVASNEYGGRRGGQFSIPGFPRKMTVTGLAVFIDENRARTDTRVEWFADRGFTNLIGAATIAADRRGLVPVVMNDAARWQTLSTGELYVRITKPGGGDGGTEGALVIFYFPYMGK